MQRRHAGRQQRCRKHHPDSAAAGEGRGGGWWRGKGAGHWPANSTMPSAVVRMSFICPVTLVASGELMMVHLQAARGRDASGTKVTK